MEVLALFFMAFIGVVLSAVWADPPTRRGPRGVDSLDVPPPPVAPSRPVTDLLNDFPDETPPTPRGGSGQVTGAARMNDEIEQIKADPAAYFEAQRRPERLHKDTR